MCGQSKQPQNLICLEDFPPPLLCLRGWIIACCQSNFELNHLLLPENRMFPFRKGAGMVND